MATFVNLTPHTINVVKEDGNILNIPASGTVARCAQFETVITVENGIKITRQEFGKVYDLPNEFPGVLFVVSRLVASACSNRKDLVCPGPLVRGTDGQPIGCKGLSVI